jgi:hypothetical protein
MAVGRRSAVEPEAVGGSGTWLLTTLQLFDYLPTVDAPAAVS